MELRLQNFTAQFYIVNSTFLILLFKFNRNEKNQNRGCPCEPCNIR